MVIDGLNDILKTLKSGGKGYKMWVGALMVLAVIGIAFYYKQATDGLIVS